jgi:hypothetical protein
MLNGRPVIIYDAHVEEGNLVIDVRTWADAATGLPLKLVQQSQGGRLVVAVYDYNADR